MDKRFRLAVLAFPLACTAQAANFSGTYFFGDSLTDSGAYSGLVPAGGKFTTNPGAVWSENVAAALGYTAAPTNPNNPTLSPAGTNYAEGGAQVNSGPGYGGSIAQTALSVHQQVSNFLAAHPTADKNALYGMWAGANDIFYQLQFAATLLQASSFASSNNFGGAQAVANIAVAQANDTTDATRQASMLTVATAALNAAQANDAAGVATSAQQSIGVAQQLVALAATEEINEIRRLKAAGVKYILVLNLPDIGATPTGIAGGALVGGSLTALSNLYNTTLSNGLRDANLSVIALNVHDLMQEILLNPAPYGITNISVPACNTSSSLICTPADLVAANAASTYFFADGVHPTTATHAMVAQYALSVIDAPLQMAQLPNIAAQNARYERSTLNDRLQVLRTTGREADDRLDVFINVGGGSTEQSDDHGTPGTSGDSRELMVGGDRRLGTTGHLGFAVAMFSGNHDFNSNRGDFDQNEVSVSLYGGVIADGFYTQAYAQYGWDNYENINRKTILGQATRSETSDTKGSRYGAGATGGYSWTFEQIHTGPFVEMHYQSISVDSFNENENDSLSMHYDKQSTKSLLGNLGWTVDVDMETAGTKWHPFARAVFDREFNNDDREVTAGLRSVSTEFSLPVAAADRSYMHYDLGVVADLNTWNASLFYTGTAQKDDGSLKAINLMLSKRF